MTTETTQVEVAGTPATPSEPTEVKEVGKDTPEVTAASGEVGKEQVEERRFTQAELDAAIQKRLLKEERRVHRRIEQQLRDAAQQRALTVEPKRDDFKDDESYTQATIDHLAEKRAAEKLAERERTREAEQRNEKFLERAEKASERYPDFQSVVFNPQVPINDHMAEFIAESDHGADVAYHLGKNPAEAARIAQMSAVKAARELTRIEAEIAAKPKATPSKAPEPITPVGSRNKSSTGTLPSDSDDIDTWMRKERERVRTKYR